jgi:hypothetical protein
MKIYGHSLYTRTGIAVVTSPTKSGAKRELARLLREFWDLPKNLPKTDRYVIEQYAQYHQDEQLDDFTDEIELDVNALSKLDVNCLRDAYIEALNKANRAHRSKRWLDNQMQELNDSLPKDWYVYSSDELAEIRREG